jgi:hypothetical protein
MLNIAAVGNSQKLEYNKVIKPSRQGGPMFSHDVIKNTFLALAFFSQTTSFATDLELAPEPFDLPGGTAVFTDIERVDAHIKFDVATQKATARAYVRFKTSDNGFPIVDLVPRATSVSLNGKAIDATLYKDTASPGSATTYKVLMVEVQAEDTHELVVEYAMQSSLVSFVGKAVRTGFFMNDLQARGRGFSENYIPSGLEYDQHIQSIRIQLVNTDQEHIVMHNGVATENGDNDWTINFPDYFTTSSMYLHLFEQGHMVVAQDSIPGINGGIPIISYARTASLARSGLSTTISTITELNQVFGGYAHNSFVAYMTPNGGGMEHCGATMSSSGALRHEIAHSWFARGVMPSSGPSGWIDEAMATWIANGYQRASSGPNRPSVSLTWSSPYRRETNQRAYTEGARLVSEFDYMFRNLGGMKALMKMFFGQYARKPITIDQFQSHLETNTNTDLSSIFSRYVYGRGLPDQDNGLSVLSTEHPKPYSIEELKSLL